MRKGTVSYHVLKVRLGSLGPHIRLMLNHCVHQHCPRRMVKFRCKALDQVIVNMPSRLPVSTEKLPAQASRRNGEGQVS
jgi:hypothetical protein